VSAQQENTERRVAVITGAGRGIGRAVAIAMAREGFALCLASRSREELEQTRALTGLAPAQSLIVLVDLAQPEAPEQLCSTALSHFGRIDVLVNNAGWAPPRTPLVKLADHDIDRMLAVNLRAPIATTRLAALQMARQQDGGTIINVASSAARTTPRGETVYAAAKAGLVAFTRASFAELRSNGIKICVIVPGLVDTSFIPENKRLNRASMLKPEEVATAVMTLVNSPPSSCPLELVLEPQHDPMRGS
jgi:3-oxoacyl-[acyl-carrier protein] reductase